MTFSAAMGSLAAARKFVHDGVTYTVTGLTAARRAEFERELQGRALSAVLLLRGKVDQQTYEEAYSRCLEDIAGNRFGFYTEASQRAIRTPGGLLLLAAVLFGTDTDTMAQLMSERTDEVKALVEIVLEESRVNPRVPGGEKEEPPRPTQPARKKRPTRSGS